MVRLQCAYILYDDYVRIPLALAGIYTITPSTRAMLSGPVGFVHCPVSILYSSNVLVAVGPPFHPSIADSSSQNVTMTEFWYLHYLPTLRCWLLLWWAKWPPKVFDYVVSEEFRLIWGDVIVVASKEVESFVDLVSPKYATNDWRNRFIIIQASMLLGHPTSRGLVLRSL